MKKWEQEQKQKIHNSKIKNAKSTIKTPNSVTLEIESKFASEDDAGLFAILKFYNLQQYTKRLSEIGFEHDLKRLAYLSSKEIDEITNIIKMLPGHKLKFVAMIEALKFPKKEEKMSRSNSTNLQKPRKSSITDLKRKTSAGATSSKLSRNSIRHISEQRDIPIPYMDTNESTMINDEQEQQLKQELHQAQQRIEELTRALSLQQLQQQNSVELNTKESSTKYSETASSPNELFNPFEPIEKVTREEIGVSYDSSKMRSTLHHLDIEEMCKCLSKAVKALIIHGMCVQKNRDAEPSLRESLNYLPDFYDETPKPEISKQRLTLISSSATASGTSLDYSQDSCIHLNPIELDEIEERSQEYSPQKIIRDAGDVLVPLTMNQIFRAEFDDPLLNQAPSEDEIYNFSKNMIIRCRMEKECSLICLIYIERLIEKTGLYITEKNWKRLVLLCLILASKVWDDESYENKHFSQAFTVVSLRELNSMEMVFLGLIDYEVGIKNSDYAKYYFVMRTYAEKNNRSFPLKPMSVDTVIKLQKNADKVENELRDQHNEALYQTL